MAFRLLVSTHCNTTTLQICSIALSAGFGLSELPYILHSLTRFSTVEVHSIFSWEGKSQLT